ncbi:MAG: ATP-binding protein [Ardenticatenaceae bacterium]|nr:ATP-binding protein [Ardenticatenaceae bacterium]
MTNASLLLVIAATLSLLAVLRLSRTTPRYVYVLVGIALWGVLSSVIHLWMDEGGLKSVFLYLGYTAVWAGLFTLILDNDEFYWNIPLILGLAVLMILAPQLTLDLLQWGAVVAIPLVTRQFLLMEEDLDEFAFGVSADSFASTLVGKFDQASLDQDRPVLEALHIGVLLSDPNGDIHYVNGKAAALLGVSRNDLIGQSIMTVLSRLPMIAKPSEDHHRPSPTRFELNGRHIEGQMFIVNDPGESLLGTIAILSDVTEIFQSERAKNSFLTTVSHELRTPLTAIKGYVEMLEGDNYQNLTQEQRSYLETIQRNVSRMVQQINSLIFVAAIKDPSLDIQHAVADLRQIVPEIGSQLEPLATRNQLEIKYTLDGDLRPIQADAQHVATILQELISNSIRFTESGGVINIRVRFEKGSTLAQSFVVVEIQDTGIGISKEDQKSIFDEFYRQDAQAVNRKRSIGVGLAIVRALVEAYNGRIWLESEVGEGSKFTFILPTKQPVDEQLILPVD